MAKTATSTVKNATGETEVERDEELNTAADPKTANGDVARKEAGISASATAEQVLSNGGIDTIDHTAKDTERPDVPAQPDPDTVAATATGAPVDGRILTAVTIAGVRYEPNDIIEGVPESLAKQHIDAIDTHPEAVNYARAQGFPAKAFAAE